MGSWGNRSIMWNYMAEEEELLKKGLAGGELQRLLECLPRIGAMYVIAHGSSYHAALAMADFMARYMKIRVYVYTPGNFIASCTSIEREDRTDTCVMAISQTGTSRGVLDGVKRAKNMGFYILGITAAAGSPLEMVSDYSLDIGCGEEDSNAKTKGYSCTLLLLMRLALEYGYRYGVILQEHYNSVMEELRKSTALIGELIIRTIQWCEKEEIGKGMTEVCVLGQGMNFATAMEGALKLMETMCIPSMFNEITEFSHGMHRAVTAESTIFLIHTDSLNSSAMVDTFYYLLKKTKHVYMLNCSKDTIVHNHVLSQPCFPLTQSLFGITASLQVISAYVPEYNGKDPNSDSNNDFTVCAGTRVDADNCQ